MRRYLAAVLIAAAPCLVLTAHYLGRRVWLQLAVAAGANLAVELAFAAARRKRPSGGTLAYAALFVLILPPAVPLWMTALGAAAGTLFGKEVFGGVGGYIFLPALVSKGFLLYSYPQDVQGVYFGSLVAFSGSPEAWLAGAALTAAGAVVFAGARPENLRILAAVLLGGVGTAVPLAAAGHLPYATPLEFIAADGFLFGAVFLAADPAGSPRDNEGKWLFGLLVGTTAVLMRCFSTYSEAMLSALLVGNLFTPLIDALALDAGPSEENATGRAA
jgi:Na+-transporting NADH:ubiquinone oxidoreductase subunit B